MRIIESSDIKYRQIDSKRIEFSLPSIPNLMISGIISVYDISTDSFVYRSMMKLSHFALTSRPAFLAGDH